MSVLICGSLAFDTITAFPGRFAQQILPEIGTANLKLLAADLQEVKEDQDRDQDAERQPEGRQEAHD